MRALAWAGALLALIVTGCAASKPAPSATDAARKLGAPAASGAGPEAMIAPVTPTAAATPLPPPGQPGPVLLPPSGQPLVSIQLRFRTGSVDDPDGQAGISALAAEVMFEGGTETLTSQQLREALFPYAADWSVRVDKEQTTFAIRVHRDGLEKVAGLLTDALTHPRWDPAEFARLRDAVVNDIEKRLRQGDDENLGKEALGELMFAGHRYGWLTSGHVGDLRSLDAPRGACPCGTGLHPRPPLDRHCRGLPRDLQARLTAALQALPATGAPAPVLTWAVPRRPRFLLVEKQTDSMAISIGAPWALGRGDPDWAAMTVARSAFGEHRQFNGRLMQRLREVRGLNYGDYAYLEAFVQEGGQAPTAQTGRARRQQAFSIWIRPVQNENALFALRAALYELQRSLGEEPFSDAEVARTRSFLDGYLLLFAQTDARKLGYALDGQFLGVNDFLARWRASVPAITTAQANEAWRRWVHPEQMQIVIVTPDATALKKAILANAPSPIHYPKDAQGKPREVPKAVSDADAIIAAFPLGAQGDEDVRIVKVNALFE